jgi:hypothetical protein
VTGHAFRVCVCMNASNSFLLIACVAIQVLCLCMCMNACNDHHIIIKNRQYLWHSDTFATSFKNLSKVWIDITLKRSGQILSSTLQILLFLAQWSCSTSLDESVKSVLPTSAAVGRHKRGRGSKFETKRQVRPWKHTYESWMSRCADFENTQLLGN